MFLGLASLIIKSTISSTMGTPCQVPGSATDDRKVFTLSKWDELYQKVWPGVIAGENSLLYYARPPAKYCAYKAH